MLKRGCIWIFCFLSWSLAAFAESPLQTNSAPRDLTRTALVLYDGANTNADGLMLARQVGNLMGHFGFRAAIQHLSAYNAGSEVNYGAVFVCGLAERTVVPAPLLDDLAQRNGPTVWIHLHLDQFTSRTNIATRLGFSYIECDDESRFTTVTYNGTKIPNEDNPELDRLNIFDKSKVQVMATATDEDDSETVPYVVRSGNFWYFAGPGSSFTAESDVSLVFADVLHDILGVHHPKEYRALARIEDVSANSDPNELRRVADILAARRIPFQIALIPLFKDPNNHVDMVLSDKPDVVEAVRYMVSRGGTVVMHGITHQLHGVTGDDYEFWDALENRATPDGALGVLSPKVQRGLEECFHAGLYPLAFETPHYAASLEHYRSLATIFSHCYERRVLTGDDNTQQYFPFPTTDIYGQAIVPENLGYVPIENPDSAPVIAAAHRLKAVRDPLASFFFHPFMPAKYLEQILDAMQADGYRFVSLKDFAPSLAVGDYAVSAQPRTVTVSPLQSFLKITTVDAHGERADTFQAVEHGKPVTVELKPPAGGLVAMQSVSHIPQKLPELTWWERFQQRVSGRDSNVLPVGSIHAREALILGSSPAFESVLGVYGIPWRHLELTNSIPDDAFVIVPHDAILDDAVQKRLAKWVEQGGRVVVENQTSMAEKLGFEFDGRTVFARRLEDFLMPDVPITPAHPLEVKHFTPPATTVTLVEETAGELPVAVASRVGDGMVIYLGAELDADTGLGYTRFPFLVQHLRQRFGIEPPVTADGAEFYFDPGFRERASLEKLVNAWHAEGIRAIYAAGWHSYPKWTFDYDRLIKLCHAQGIAVYAWLELPHVSPKFWEEHPEWREKTASGADAEVGWRKFMNFANVDCRAAALKSVDELLSRHDWDGVNIAELSFDTEDGLEKPAGYIPMNADVRAQFQQQAGFDPQQLFQDGSTYHWRTNAAALKQWNSFRTGLTRDWLADVLGHVSRRHLDVIVTELDGLTVPGLIDKTGSDPRDVIALMDRFHFTLQVEDPSALWSESPTRYEKFGEAYRKLVRDPSRLMFDINIVDSRGSGLAPTRAASGTELALTVRSAANAGNGRVGIYSEFTILPEDRALLGFVLGAGTQLTTRSNVTVVSASRPVRVQYASTPERSAVWNLFHHTAYEPWPVPTIDDQSWSCGAKGLALLTPGEHRLRLPQGESREAIWIKDITAPFSALRETKSGFTVEYSSPRRAWLTMSREPSAVLSDGEVWNGSVDRTKGSDWIVELPAGKHHVEIQKAPTASLVIERTGEEASLSIAWLGTRGIAFLGLLYAGTRVRRFALRLARRFKREG